VLLIKKAGKFHYTWVKNLSRLLYDQSKHWEKNFCKRFRHGYSGKDLLRAHMPECHGISQTEVPVEILKDGKNRLIFQNQHKQLPAPFIIYANFKVLTTKIEGLALNLNQSKKVKVAHTRLSSLGFQS